MKYDLDEKKLDNKLLGKLLDKRLHWIDKDLDKALDLADKD